MQLTSARILDRHYFQSISSTMNLDSRCLLLVAMDDLYYYATGTYDYSNRNSPVEVRRYVAQTNFFMLSTVMVESYTWLIKNEHYKP